jgi:[acyl-carrier-protein] S-malonyltransferase
MGKTAALFTGQGAQAPGMGADLVAESPAARAVFESANEALGFDLAEICFRGNAEQLEATDVQQPAILTVSIAALRAFEERCGDGVAIEAAAGLSLGEYAALHAADALTFETAVRLVHQRGKFMQAAAEATAGGMVSVMGLEPGAVEEICRELRSTEPIQPANYNCPGQIVISGAASACEAARNLVEARGGRAIPLKVAGAFHSPLMASAADAMREVLAGVTFRAPRIPVVANVTGQYHPADRTIAPQLVEQITSPIRWQSSMELLIADGYDRFYEFGPGRVLAGLMRKIDRRVKVHSVSGVSGLQEVATAT